MISASLVSDGHFLMTAFDGQKIIDLLKEKDWETDIYSIKKQYKSNLLQTHGQKISVKLPFSPEPYDEYLINISWIADKFKMLKMSLIKTGSFSEYLPKYHKKLSTDDEKFVSLYSYYIFKKA